jgi:mRNA interferase RelE/StbE
MKNKIIVKESVYKDLSKIDREIRRRIKKKAEKELVVNPTKGKLLKGRYNGLYSYRMGNYRIIYTIIPEGIFILKVGNRKDVYRD